jgi:hypothetical protein
VKKLQKKLSLSKETLRNLSGHEMQGIVGGVTNTCCNSSTETGDSCPHCVTDFCTRFGC